VKLGGWLDLGGRRTDYISGPMRIKDQFFHFSNIDISIETRNNRLGLHFGILQQIRILNPGTWIRDPMSFYSYTVKQILLVWE